MLSNVQKSMKSLFTLSKSNYILPFEIEDYLTIHKLFLEKNIIDYTLLNSLSDILVKQASFDLYKQFQKEIISLYSIALEDFNLEQNSNSYFKMVNLTLSIFYILQHMIFVKEFYEVFFSTNSDSLFSYLTSILPKITLLSNKFPDLTDIIYQILSGTHLKIIMKGYMLGDYLTYHLQGISAINTSALSQEILSSKEIESILEKIYTLNFDYDLIFNDDINISSNDIKHLKSLFIQSVIRIVFSNSNDFTNVNDNQQKYLLTDFLRFVVNKSMNFYREKLGNNYHCMFRKEQIYDDILKYITFSFGGDFYIKHFYPFLIRLYDSEINENHLLDITELFVNFYKKLSTYLPPIFVFILKCIYNSSKEIFKLEEGNYLGCYMFLFFSFLCSPKMEDLYQIKVGVDKKVNIINKMIMKVCYNQMFKEEKEFLFFNDCIGTLNNKLNKTFDKLFEGKEVEKEKEEKNIQERVMDVFAWKNNEVVFNYDCMFVKQFIMKEY